MSMSMGLYVVVTWLWNTYSSMTRYTWALSSNTSNSCTMLGWLSLQKQNGCFSMKQMSCWYICTYNTDKVYNTIKMWHQRQLLVWKSQISYSHTLVNMSCMRMQVIGLTKFWYQLMVKINDFLPKHRPLMSVIAMTKYYNWNIKKIS